MARYSETEPEVDSSPGTLPPSNDRDERLGEAIEEYLALAEAGTPADPEVFARRYPDLGEDLKAALDGLAMVQGLVGSSGTGPGARLEAGRRVAGYRIVRELGRGGMGIVYEAVHVDLDRPVALKVLGMHAAPDSTGRRRFLNEAKTAAGLHHTHIVPVFDVGQVGGLCYYAMQRIEGCGLDRVVKALRKGRSTAAGSGSMRRSAIEPEAGCCDLLSGTSIGDLSRSRFSLTCSKPGVPRDERPDEAPPFEPPRGSEYYRWVARAGSQAAEALAHAHRRGVIHRDVKPSNLLVDARGTVWVADFGLARRLADPAMTQTDSLLGTPRYMSPEQSQLGPVDGRTDVYSLGSTLYELLTLRPPFEGKTAAELVVQIRDKEPIAPRKFDPKLPRDLETIVLKAMAKRPSDRYANASELSEDLSRFLATEPVKARRIGPIGRSWRFVRRHPSLTAVSTIATVAILATATVAYVRVWQERNKAVAATGEKDEALTAVRRVNQELKDAMIQNLWRDARSARQMRVPDMRKTGLARLNEAVRHGPGAAMIPLLRDEAVQLLAIRDIEPKAPIASGPAQRLVFAGSSGRLATLSADGSELSLWNLDRNERTARHPLSEGNGEDGHAPWMRRLRPGLTSAGSSVAVPRPGRDGVRIFDVENGIFTDLPIPGRRVSNLALTPDGQRLVVVDDDTRPSPRGPRGGGKGGLFGADMSRVTLWDTKRRDAPVAVLALPEIKPDSIASRIQPPVHPLIAASPDGKTIAAAWFLDAEITLWDAEDGRKRASIPTEGAITSLALGADGTLAVAINGSISRWDAAGPAKDAAPKPLPGLSLHQPFVAGIRFSPDASILAVTGPFNSVELWDPEANALLTTVPTAAPVSDVAFSPDGRTIAATVAGASTNGTRIWAVVDPIGRSRLAAPETKPPSRLHSLAFGPTGTLATTFWNQTTASARLQCPEGGVATRELLLRNLSVGFDPAGRLIVPHGDLLEFYRSPRDLTPERTLALPEFGSPGRGGGGPKPSDSASVVGCVPSPDGRVLALIRFGDMGLFRFGDLVLVRFGDDDQLPTLTCVHPPGSGDGGRGRNPRPGPSGGTGPGSSPPPGDRGRGAGFGDPRTFVLSQDGTRLFAVAGDRSEPRAWSLDGDRAVEIHWTATHRDVSRMALGPDGRTLALGHFDGSVSIVDGTDGTLFRTIPAPDAPDGVTALAYSHGGELAIGFRSGAIRLWSARPGSPPTPLVSLPGHPGQVTILAYSPDSRRLAAGDDSGADIWELAQLRTKLDAIGLGW